MVTPRFAERAVLVTGADRGLGAAIAHAFAAEGAHVGVGYRVRERDAQAVVAAIEEAGGSATAVCLDVRDRAAVRHGVESFAATRGVHVLVNNAAIIRDQFVPMMADAEWDDVLHVNLSGAWNVTRAALPHLMRARGNVVNVASVAGIRASPGQANYAASKGGLLALTSTMATELAARGVRVNAVVPGLLDTGMGERLDHRTRDRGREAIPLKRFGTGAEVAHAVCFLASDAASYIVGHHLVVDGGLSL